MLNALEDVWVGLLRSTTLTVKLDVPAPAGVPVMIPSLDNVKPLGSVPDCLDQV